MLSNSNVTKTKKSLFQESFGHTRQGLGNTGDVWKLVHEILVLFCHVCMAFLVKPFTSMCQFNAPVAVVLSFLFISSCVVNQTNMCWGTPIFTSQQHIDIFWKGLLPRWEQKSDWQVQKQATGWGPERERRQATSCYFCIQEALHGNRPNLIWEH